VDVEDGPGRAAAPGGDLGDIGEEEGIETVEGREGDSGDLGERGGDHAEPHRRGHGREGEDVGEQARQGDFFEDVGDQRRRCEGRRDRDGDALREGPPPGADAARSGAIGSARRPAAGEAAELNAAAELDQEPSADRGREEQDPEDGGEAQLPADVAGDGRVDRQGQNCR
jgi:hypothetical protein